MAEPLFQPRPDRPMHIAVFGSGSGTTLRFLLASQQTAFAIRLLFTDRECGFQNIAKEHNLFLIHHPWDRSIPREEYDRQGLKSLLSFSQNHRCPIDLILLAGYMRLMSPVWLKAFPYRILNMHPADLTILDEQGNRKFIGDNAVFKALESGEKKTRSTAILIDEKVDGGPILVSGPWTFYLENDPITKERAALHQEKQKAKSDWPACLTALTFLAQGRISFDPARCELFLDDKKLPSCGYEQKG